MKLHIFNPEHDIALAYNKPHISVPHAAQELRMNLGFLPSLWADDGDCVLVDDIKYALKVSNSFRNQMNDVLFVEKGDLKNLPVCEVLPWGWDRRIKAELVENGVDGSLLPDDSKLDIIRELSGRRHTVELLKKLRDGIEKVTCGESFVCYSNEDIEGLLRSYRAIVLKAPWSSSGRGIRYVTGKYDDAKRLWAKKTIMHQGYIMAEPHYNKVCDFALEFVADSGSRVECRGLSMFHTLNGKYTGNIISSEDDKRFRLARYVDIDLLDIITCRLENILSENLGGKYVGRLGVDMMAVADIASGKLLLHPCVEVNLRGTMGHVALELSNKRMEFASMMSISHEVNYQLKISRIEGKFVNVIFR